MKNRTMIAALLAVGSGAFTLVGCGREEVGSAPATAPTAASTPAAAPAPGGGAPAGPQVYDAAKGTAGVKGSVKFKGEAPARRKVDMGTTDQACMHHKDAVLDESVIVNTNGTLKDAFVYVKKGLERWTFTVPATAATLTQQGCMYIPHVQGIQVGQPLEIVNDDETTHNILHMPSRNAEFNFTQQKGMKNTKTFSEPEIMMAMNCNVHGWMHSYVGVVAHPFFQVTGDDGSFELKGLPPGTYDISVWSESCGTKTEKITIGDNETRSVDFELSLKE